MGRRPKVLHEAIVMLFHFQRSHPYLARHRMIRYAFFDTRRLTPGTIGAAGPTLGSHSSNSGFPYERLYLILSAGSPQGHSTCQAEVPVTPYARPGHKISIILPDNCLQKKLHSLIDTYIRSL